MISKEIEEDFRKKVCDEIQIIVEGINRARVITPFKFDDGDHLVIILKKEENRWILTDEGHTFMHLTYWIDEDDFYKGTRKKIIDDTLSMFDVIDRNGEIILLVKNREFGNALYSFIQSLLKITDITYLSRERVHSTFFEDFRSFISEEVPEEKRVFDYYDRIRDPDENYKVDCKIGNENTSLFIFAINSDNLCNIATITCMQYERWNVKFDSLGIFEIQEEINRKVLARFSDICGKTYSNLPSNRDRIKEYIAPYIHI